jgi:hypothetical protein
MKWVEVIVSMQKQSFKFEHKQRRIRTIIPLKSDLKLKPITANEAKITILKTFLFLLEYLVLRPVKNESICTNMILLFLYQVRKATESEKSVS